MMRSVWVQGMDPALFDSYHGYPNGKADILSTQGGASFITTPNVVKSVAVRPLQSPPPHPCLWLPGNPLPDTSNGRTCLRGAFGS